MHSVLYKDNKINVPPLLLYIAIYVIISYIKKNKDRHVKLLIDTIDCYTTIIQNTHY